ncbi:hypothetical protein L195_g045829 [Trifolium pratense]|uniref:Transmembrane protein n=1 Tax=Trifolium pratense TaxID=57577 RepID=A0A2K3MFY7_TRIPR|nr:hypothetical protein L195_g045829 [Trifolium pratense]
METISNVVYDGEIGFRWRGCSAVVIFSGSCGEAFFLVLFMIFVYWFGGIAAMVSFPPSVSYFYSVCFWVMGGCFDGGGSGLNMEVEMVLCCYSAGVCE